LENRTPFQKPLQDPGPPAPVHRFRDPGVFLPDSPLELVNYCGEPAEDGQIDVAEEGRVRLSWNGEMLGGEDELSDPVSDLK
jgi:hypothetical protein